MIVDEFDFGNGIFGQIRYKKDSKSFFNINSVMKDEFRCYLIKPLNGIEIYLTSTRTQTQAKDYLFQLHNSRHK